MLGQLVRITTVVQQHAAQDVRHAVVAQQQAGGNRQICPGRISADGHARGIDAQGCPAFVQPARDGCDLQQRGRKPDFRGQRVVHADDDDTRARGQFAHHAIVRVEAEQGPAATVQVDQRRLQIVRRNRPVDAHAHVALHG